MAKAFEMQKNIVNMRITTCAKKVPEQDRFNSWGMSQKKCLMTLGPQKWSCKKAHTRDTEPMSPAV